MKCQHSVDLHHRKVIAKRNEGRDVDDMAGVVPKVGEKLGRSRCSQPHNVTQYDVPINSTEISLGTSAHGRRAETHHHGK